MHAPCTRSFLFSFVQFRERGAPRQAGPEDLTRPRPELAAPPTERCKSQGMTGDEPLKVFERLPGVRKLARRFGHSTVDKPEGEARRADDVLAGIGRVSFDHEVTRRRADFAVGLGFKQPKHEARKQQKREPCGDRKATDDCKGHRPPEDLGSYGIMPRIAAQAVSTIGLAR